MSIAPQAPVSAGTPSNGTSSTKKDDGPLSNRGSLEPWIKDEVKFYDHQVKGVAWMKTKKGGLLADDMGLGKSLQTLALFGMHIWRIKRIDATRNSAMLAVVPVSLRDNWEDEINKFTRLPYMKLEGTPKKRSAQIEQFKTWPADKIMVVNYEQVIPHWEELNSVGFDLLVADEAHSIKNPKAKRTKAFQNLRATRKFMLTGTPMLKHVDDLWVQLDAIAPGQWGTYWAFTHKYCVFGGYKNKQVVGLKNEQQLITKLNDVMLRRTKDEVLDLPEVQYIKKYVALSDRQKAMYNFIIENMAVDREDGNPPEPIKEGNHMVKMLRLRQVCATTATLVAHGEDTSSKLEAMEDDAQEIIENGHKLVVFTQFRPALECYVQRLKKRFGDKVPIYQIHGGVDKGDRQDIIKEWAAHEGPSIAIGIIKVMGTGLNMTAARHIQFIDKEYAPGLNKQAVDRCNRIGASETQAVQVFEYFVKGSAEMRVEQIIAAKNMTNDMIINNTDQDFERRVQEAINQKIK